MATLSLRSVKKIYEKSEIIHNFNMEIADGEFIVVVGPSGCGKSTLLRMIAGLEEITEGDIAINDKVINDLTPKNRDVAMVFQTYALYPHMTVYNNMAYGLRMHGFSKKEINKRVAKTAEFLELSAFLKRKPRELSGGQRQRVAMGRAIIREPALFLFDEPLSNLDAKLRVQMRVEIKKLQQSLKTTSIYVTHDQVEAMTLADRLVVLNKGVAEQIGTPLEIYEKPATVFVGGFIGSPSMNFISAKVNAEKNAVELLGGTRLALPSENVKLTANQTITVGIRPENIFIADSTVSDYFTLEVSHIETLGADTLLYGILPFTHYRMTVRLPGGVRPQPGEKIHLIAMPNSLHLFDSKTGVRID